MSISSFTEDSFSRGANLRGCLSLRGVNGSALRSSNGFRNFRNVNLAFKSSNTSSYTIITRNDAVGVFFRGLLRGFCGGISISLRALDSILIGSISGNTDNSSLSALNCANSSNSIVCAIGAIKCEVGLLTVKSILKVGNLRDGKCRNIALAKLRARYTNLAISLLDFGDELASNGFVSKVKSLNLSLRISDSFRLRRRRGSNSTTDSFARRIIRGSAK